MLYGCMIDKGRGMGLGGEKKEVYVNICVRERQYMSEFE